MCNRWLLAYTLLRNPSLASCRRTKKKNKPSDITVNAAPSIFMSKEGSINNDEHQEGQSNLNHSLTDLEKNSGSPVCDTLQQLDSDVTNTNAHAVGAATYENGTELEVKTLPRFDVNVDKDHLVLVDFDEGTNCQSIERSKCAKPDATNKTSASSQSPVLPMAESVCVVEPKEPQAVFPCEPVKECVTVESCRTEIRQ